MERIMARKKKVNKEEIVGDEIQQDKEEMVDLDEEVVEIQVKQPEPAKRFISIPRERMTR